MVVLRGITWEHPRGYDCLAATAEAYTVVEPAVTIRWDKRSLQEFGAVATSVLTNDYDLLVIDHPHVGTSSRDGSILPLDEWIDEEKLQALASDSVGGSHASYFYDGRQWALAIDAAAQVSAYRPDVIETPPADWSGTAELLQAGMGIWPLNPTDAICSFLTLCSTGGSPWEGESISAGHRNVGELALGRMTQAVEFQPRCLEVDPIRALDLLASSDDFVFSPMLFGYSNYARAGFREAPVRFGPLAETRHTSGGSLLGGAGIAISATCGAIRQAAEYVAWVADASCQRTVYFDAGGQPASRTAWDDARLDHITNGYFRDTRTTVETAWVRPRFPGFVSFQNAAGVVISSYLNEAQDMSSTLNELEALYASSRRAYIGAES